jgi:polysaccharide export outer membrane protein
LLGAGALGSLILSLTGCCCAQPMVAVPPSHEVPRELEKVPLPPYVIEAPDILLIQVVQEFDPRKQEDKDKPVEEKKPGEPPNVIPPAGAPEPVPGASKEPKVVSLFPQPISGQHFVRPDGTIYLGIYGSVMVAGLTLDQAAEAVRAKVAAFRGGRFKPENLLVTVDGLAYNSKRYYVITDGAGLGEQIYPFPMTGSETVLDALANINGLPQVASKRNIWVARRSPHGGPDQILPVDYVGITQHGITATNYQVLPGDRIYVQSQCIVRFNINLRKIIAPIEQMFGITFLGSETVNSIKGTRTTTTGG